MEILSYLISGLSTSYSNPENLLVKDKHLNHWNTTESRNRPHIQSQWIFDKVDKVYQRKKESLLTNDAESTQYLKEKTGTLTLRSYHILNINLKWSTERYVNSILMCTTPSLHRLYQVSSTCSPGLRHHRTRKSGSKSYQHIRRTCPEAGIKNGLRTFKMVHKRHLMLHLKLKANLCVPYSYHLHPEVHRGIHLTQATWLLTGRQYVKAGQFECMVS